MHAGISVDQDTFGSETLRTVAGDGIAVVMVTMTCRVDFDLPPAFQSHGNAVIW